MRKYPEHPITAVSGVIFYQLDQVILVRRANPPAEGKWSLPGGVVQLGEPLEDALKREISEECGLQIQVGPILEVSSRIIRDQRDRVVYHYILLDYLCRAQSGEPRSGSDARELRLVPLHQVHKFDLTEGVLEIIKKGERRIKEKSASDLSTEFYQ